MAKSVEACLTRPTFGEAHLSASMIPPPLGNKPIFLTETPRETSWN